MVVLGLVFGGFGLIVGSFLNVLILRQGTGRSTGGRSGCLSCRHQLQWFDLIPVFSWISLNGRCRYCRSALSIQYPLVELTTAFLFGVVGFAPLQFGLVAKVLFCITLELLISIAVYDFRHTIIPDEWVYLFCGMSFVLGYWVPSIPHSSYLLFLLSGPITTLPLFLLWFVSGGRAMGFGDVKVGVGMGYLLGWWHGLSAVLLSFIIGGIMCAPLLLFSSMYWKRLRVFFTHSIGIRLPSFNVSMKSEVPFGPFLVLATVVVWMSGLYGHPLAWPFFPL